MVPQRETILPSRQLTLYNYTIFIHPYLHAVNKTPPLRRKKGGRYAAPLPGALFRTLYFVWSPAAPRAAWAAASRAMGTRKGEQET